MSKKVAVILFNLGGPDNQKSIKSFLFNFFMDKNIIRLPLPIRFFLAKLISIRRSKREAGESYAALGNKSPLLENSQKQAKALEEKLNQKTDVIYKVFISMRYWHPMASHVVKEVKDFDPNEIIRLPLYPQFSTTTTRSSFQNWERACKKAKFNKPTTSICCYPWEEGFIRASADNIREIYAKAEKETGQAPRVLFSAHGLPEKIVKDGDPYQWQCEQSAEAIALATGIHDLDWEICYQSRVGPMKWIGPSTEEALEKAAKDRVSVVILPHAFTQEHVETLVEIDIEYREMAKEMGLDGFYSVPTVGVSDHFIQGLVNQVHKHQGALKTVSHEGPDLCPQIFKECCARKSNA